eukprot:TRINITY_DN16521_c0_g1_i2.p1 TRINITY_DN16521_c0_g1~~TRINITY_DN16521_c0_g1_i2.p1  ORF type:complete len:141 (-),score=30.52 TRINITY_DN16521_c0_g1_i2:71-493(-)
MCIRDRDISSELAVMVVEVKLPIVKDRDFVAVRWISTNPDGSAQVTTTSLQPELADSHLGKRKGFCRGRIQMQCLFIAPLASNNGPSCRVRWLSAVDPGGNIPSAKKMTGTKNAETILALQKAVYLSHPTPPAPGEFDVI